MSGREKCEWILLWLLRAAIIYGGIRTVGVFAGILLGTT